MNEFGITGVARYKENDVVFGRTAKGFAGKTTANENTLALTARRSKEK